MTITYRNGTVLKAIVLLHEENEIRAIAAGCDSVLAFTRIHHTWISSELEPVSIEFEWQRRGAAPAFPEDDCFCPKELAARLIPALSQARGARSGRSIRAPERADYAAASHPPKAETV